MAFDGLRVLTLESRRAEEMGVLIRKQGGEPIIAPSMKEIPLEDNDEALAFGERFLAGEFDALILLTGVGFRALWKVLLTKYAEEDLRLALEGVTRIVRGPKPSAALRELGFTPDVQVPEPNTWRELLTVMAGRAGLETKIALQEYGKANLDLIAGLERLGKVVTPVRIYGWAMPDDIGPLRNAVGLLASGQVDVVLFTTAVQAIHLFKIAEEEGVAQQVLEGLNSACVASIGPTTTETLVDYGVRPDFEPTHPKMGILVNEAAAMAGALLKAK